MEVLHSLEHLPIFFFVKPDTVKDTLRINNPLAERREKERTAIIQFDEPSFHILEYIAYERFQPCPVCKGGTCNHWTACELKQIWPLRKVNHRWRYLIEKILCNVITCFLPQDRDVNSMYKYWIGKRNHYSGEKCKCSTRRYGLFVDKMHWRLHWGVADYRDDMNAKKKRKTKVLKTINAAATIA